MLSEGDMADAVSAERLADSAMVLRITRGQEKEMLGVLECLGAAVEILRKVEFDGNDRATSVTHETIHQILNARAGLSRMVLPPTAPKTEDVRVEVSQSQHFIAKVQDTVNGYEMVQAAYFDGTFAEALEYFTSEKCLAISRHIGKANRQITMRANSTVIQ